MKSEVLRVDAFTDRPGKGNPAGVVLNGEQYTTENMQQIAKKVGFNETVFVCTSDIADIKLRYFTPGHETPLCGHATMGAIFAMYNNQGNQEITIETGAGILAVQYSDKTKKITMQQALPQFIPFKGDLVALCKSINIEVTDLHSDWPIQYGNTGSWTLLVPVKRAAILDQMQPDTKRFPDLLLEKPKSSIHPFAIESEKHAQFTARHFSSPFSGTIEDSVTGTASGVMGAYALNYIYKNDSKKELVISQGKQVNKEGTVFVHAQRGINAAHKIKISGSACFGGVVEIILEN